MAVPVPVATATTQTKDWRDFVDALTTNPIYGVKIPKADIDACMTSNTTGIRVYGALKVPGDITSFHLLVVGVDINGNDIVTVGANSAVYDNTVICPPLCGASNVLNS